MADSNAWTCLEAVKVERPELFPAARRHLLELFEHLTG